jgi:hypothetical protein
VLCDVCGEPGDDVRTYSIGTDGQHWEIDLDEKHAEPLLKIAHKGRQPERGRGASQYEKFIRRAN